MFFYTAHVDNAIQYWSFLSLSMLVWEPNGSLVGFVGVVGVERVSGTYRSLRPYGFLG